MDTVFEYSELFDALCLIFCVTVESFSALPLASSSAELILTAELLIPFIDSLMKKLLVNGERLLRFIENCIILV